MKTDIEISILCGSKELKTKEFFNFKELKDIWRYAGIEIDKYLPRINFSLRECQSCSLQFFEPQITGSNEFYSLFKNSDYYRIRWDYRKILKYILDYKLNSILDYGCGQGRFLKKLPDNIYKVGIDYNVETLKEKNLKLIKSNLLDFEDDRKFEGIISIQVLEHLSNNGEYLRKMVNLLKTEGYLFLAVPNRQGILKMIENKVKPLDFPPHHLTRWSKKTLEKIAEIYNLKIIDIIEEPLSYQHFKWMKQGPIGVKYMGRGLKKRIIRKIIFIFQAFILPIFYLSFRKKVLGHSILIIFQKQIS